MPVTIKATRLFPEDDGSVDGKKQSSADVPWLLSGTTSKAAALAKLATSMDATWDGLLYESTRWSKIGRRAWLALVHYTSDTDPDEADWTFSFDTTGGQMHMNVGYDTRAYIPAGGAAAPDHKHAIAVDRDLKVAGVDVPAPALKFTISATHPYAQITKTYVVACARLVGKVNSATFFGFAAKEVMYLGSTGRQSKAKPVTLDHHFVASENVTNLVLGDITVAQKDGHEFIWPWFGKTVDKDTLIVRPVAIYVSTVARAASFSGIFAGITSPP